MAKSKMMMNAKNSSTYPQRGAEKRDVVINSYMSIDKMPMTLGQQGPVYYIPSNDTNSSGYMPLAYRDQNRR
jgi:hypothetical protein